MQQHKQQGSEDAETLHFVDDDLLSVLAGQQMDQWQHGNADHSKDHYHSDQTKNGFSGNFFVRCFFGRFVSESHFKKFDFLLDGKRTELLIFLVFLLPGLPKDALTYLVSFNPKIKPMYLFFLTTLGRTPATVLTVFMGKSLWEGNYILTIVLAGVIVLLAAAGIFIKRKVDKRAAQKHQLSDETADNKYGKE